MIISRGRSILKLCTRTPSLLSNTQIQTNMQNYMPKKWHGQYLYRTAPDPKNYPKREMRYVEFLSAFVWWWILWHFFSEYEALIGPPTPDPEKWTDEELGIPPL